jgi:hypothetical protein
LLKFEKGATHKWIAVIEFYTKWYITCVKHKKTKHMRALFFLLFVCPVAVFAQNQQVPATNGATDCPTFGKKNTSSKAGFFQYMRSNKPPKPEQQTVYRTSALPTLKPAAEEEEAIAQRKQKRAERAAARKQRQSQSDPVPEEEPIVATSTYTKPAETTAEEPVEAKVMTNKPADAKAMADKQASIENESSAKDEEIAKRMEKRDKKVRKAARKEKIQHFFKRTNKPSSRKNVQKCPQF